MFEAKKNKPEFALMLLERFQQPAIGQGEPVDRAPALPLASVPKLAAPKLRAMVPATVDDYLAFMKSAEERYPEYFAQMDTTGGITTWNQGQLEAFAAAAPHPFLAGWVWGRMLEMMSAGQFSRRR